MGKMAKGVGVAAVAGAAALLYFGPGQGWFPGSGTGSGEGETTAQTAGSAESTGAEIPDTIVVSVEEKQVTINGIVVEDEEALKALVEEYNSDSRTFVLEDKTAILETYDWVTKVFDDLGITPQQSSDAGSTAP